MLDTVLHSAHSHSQVGIEVYDLVIHIKLFLSMIDILAEYYLFFCVLSDSDVSLPPVDSRMNDASFSCNSLRLTS